MTTSNDYPSRQITRSRRLSRSLYDLGITASHITILQAMMLAGLVLDAVDDLTSGGVEEAIRRIGGGVEDEA